MIKSLPQIIVTIGMFVFGVATLFYTNEVRSLILKIMGKKGFFYDRINSNQAKLSMRVSGFFAILMGLFSLWVFWQH